MPHSASTRSIAASTPANSFAIFAKNQLTVSRVRSAERTYRTMERAVEELFLRGSIDALGDALALIESITLEEVRTVFERMLRHPPALAITAARRCA